MTTEVKINISKLEILESNGFFLQELQLINNSVEIFSIKSSLTIGQGSVCAIAFLDEKGHPVAVSMALRYDIKRN